MRRFARISTWITFARPVRLSKNYNWRTFEGSYATHWCMGLRSQANVRIHENIVANREADFWGPASNFGIPLAAIADMSKDPEMYVMHTSTNSTNT